MRKKKKHIKGQVKIGKRSRGIVFMSRRSTLSVIFSGLAAVFLGATLTLMGVPVLQTIWYMVFPNTSIALENILHRPAVSFEEVVQEEPEIPWQPDKDETWPMENWLVIEAIGVKTKIIEQPDEMFEEALRQGVWRVPEFGNPFERELPTILAAHRFGYLKWTNTYRRENSFFNLPKLAIGDRVQIIWDQRKYTYEIYDEEEAAEISNYTAELILYTCKFLESDERIFKYGRLIKE